MGWTGGINEPCCLMNNLESFHLAAHVLFLDGCTLVILLLASCQGDQEFCISVVRDVEFDSHNGESLLLHRPLELSQLLPGQQELALAARVMLSPASPPVLGNMHVLDIQLVVVEIAKGVHQRGLARPDGLYLSACKHHSRLEGLDELIVKRSPPVLYLHTALCFRHNPSFSSKHANVMLFK